MSKLAFAVLVAMAAAACSTPQQTTGTAVGATVGAVAGGPVGAVVGGTAGAIAAAPGGPVDQIEGDVPRRRTTRRR